MEIYIREKLVSLGTVNGTKKYRKIRIDKGYKSATEARKTHNLKLCNYEHVNDMGRVVKRYYNAKIDAYGRKLPNEVCYGEIG